MNDQLNPFVLAVIIALPATVTARSHAQSVDLTTWTEESYGAGVWTVAADGLSVYQSVNGEPTLFYSDFNAFNTSFRGVATVETASDDDFFGFALGFQPGDSTNLNADYLLVDWKMNTQTTDFGGPSCTPGSTAMAGLAVSRAIGIPTADEFWGHVNFDRPACSDLNSGLAELQRGLVSGSTGWGDFVEYEFQFDFTATSLKVFVDGVLELDISGSFADGRIAFYNFSQACVRYSGFTVIPLGACCFPDGSCADLGPNDCVVAGGTPQGKGTACRGDGDGNGIDDACELQACCFPDGSCADLGPNDCVVAGGTPQGEGTDCFTSNCGDDDDDDSDDDSDDESDDESDDDSDDESSDDSDDDSSDDSSDDSDDAHGAPVVTNSILRGNSDTGGVDESAQIDGIAGSPMVNYSDVQGEWSGAGGIGNISADPRFVDDDGEDGIPGTEDDDFRLKARSPSIDAGDNSAVPADTFDLDGDGNTSEATPFDLDGNPRFQDATGTTDTGNGVPPLVDMGAYESQGITPPPCLEDVNGDGTINILDLIDLLLCFGQPAIPGCVGEDINEDGLVNVLDLIDLLTEFGTTCP